MSVIKKETLSIKVTFKTIAVLHDIHTDTHRLEGKSVGAYGYRNTDGDQEFEISCIYSGLC